MEPDPIVISDDDEPDLSPPDTRPVQDDIQHFRRETISQLRTLRGALSSALTENAELRKRLRDQVLSTKKQVEGMATLYARYFPNGSLPTMSPVNNNI